MQFFNEDTKILIAVLGLALIVCLGGRACFRQSEEADLRNHEVFRTAETRQKEIQADLDRARLAAFQACVERVGDADQCRRATP